MSAVDAALVLPLTAVGGSGASGVGGKAAWLGALLRADLPVPDGVVLRADAPADAALDALDAARERLGGRVAVRSSAADEDLATGSAAGRYLTVLDVADRAALAAAVAACRASGGAQRAGMAVVVQAQVAADMSGVAFTADPVTGERDVVVVVAGTPGAVTEGGPGREWRLRPAARGTAGAGPPTHPLAGEPRGSLPAAQVREVARLAVAAAEVVGGPADVEWAVAAGEVVLLQARPLTGLPDPPRWESPLPGGWLRNFRLGEWLPGPVTPLFESWFVNLVEDGVRARAARESGLVMQPPLHVVVGGWYFHAPLGATPMPTLLGALPRNPRFALASILVTPRPEWSERLVVRGFARSWEEVVRPAHERAAAGLDGAGSVERDLAAVAAVADSTAGVLWSLSMVGGFAWKLEAAVRRLLARGLAVDEATRLASALCEAPAPSAGPGPAVLVESLDWVHPPVTLEARPPSRDRSADNTGLAAAKGALGPRRWRRVGRLAALARRYAALREEQAAALGAPWPQLRAAVQRLGVAARDRGALAGADDIWFLQRDELHAALRPTRRAGSGAGHDLAVEPAAAAAPLADLDRRRALWASQHRLTPPLQLGVLPPPVAALLPAPSRPVPGALLTGQPGSPGRATGRVAVAADVADAARLQAGEVLVAPLVTPAYLPVVARAAAVVTDGGTIAAHSALVCRELGIPLVVATGDATRTLLDGETVTVDGTAGTVTARG